MHESEDILTYFVWNSSLITLSLHLRGRLVTKGKEITIFCKDSAALWRTPTISRRFSDRFTGQSFEVSFSNFPLLCWFFENLALLSSLFKKLPAIDFLAFRVIWKQAFRIRFLDISKTLSLRSNPLTNVKFLQGYDILFSRFLLLSTYKETSESIRPFCRKNLTWVNNLKMTTVKYRVSKKICYIPGNSTL